MRLPIRLTLAVGAAEVRLRQRFPRLMEALAPGPAERDKPFAELQRLESDPAYRESFFAELDAAIALRRTEWAAELDAFVDEVETTADRLRTPSSSGSGECAV